MYPLFHPSSDESRPSPPVVACSSLSPLLLAGRSSLLIDHAEPGELRAFGSEAEMHAFISSHQPAKGGWGFFGNVRDDVASMEDAAGHSNTNVQVAGVDEGDMVKTDGENIYISDGEAVHISRRPAVQRIGHLPGGRRPH